MDVNGLGGSDGSAAARLRQSIQARLRNGQQVQSGRFVNAAMTNGAANPGGVRFGDDPRVASMGAGPAAAATGGPAGADVSVVDGAGAGAVDASGAASGSADPAGVARARRHDEAGEVEGHHEEAEEEQGEHRVGHLEVAVRAPGEVADPAGVAQATAARGTAAYRRTAEATELRAASPGISVAA